MAVPTISTIGPSKGHTGGRTLVEITGSNFRLPTIQAAGETDRQSLPLTVAVYFGDEPARSLIIVSGSRLYAETPIHDPGVVAIKVENLDDNGSPIASESVTQANAFEFVRPIITTEPENESDLQRVVRTFVLELQRQILENVQISQHTDFDEAGNVLIEVVHVAELPGLALVGPDVEENRFYSINAEPEHDVEGLEGVEFNSFQVPRTVDLTFTIVGVSDRKMELLNLQHAAEYFFAKNFELRMLRDQNDPSLGFVEYEIALTEDFNTTGVANNSNLWAFEGKAVIRGFDIETLAGVDLGIDNSVIRREAYADDDPVTLELEQLSPDPSLVVRSILSPGEKRP